MKHTINTLFRANPIYRRLAHPLGRGMSRRAFVLNFVVGLLIGTLSVADRFVGRYSPFRFNYLFGRPMLDVLNIWSGLSNAFIHFFPLFLSAWIAARAALFVARERANDSYTLLMLTTVSDAQILTAYWLGALRRMRGWFALIAGFYLPPAIYYLLEFMAGNIPVEVFYGVLDNIGLLFWLFAAISMSMASGQWIKDAVGAAAFAMILTIIVQEAFYIIVLPHLRWPVFWYVFTLLAPLLTSVLFTVLAYRRVRRGLA